MSNELANALNTANAEAATVSHTEVKLAELREDRAKAMEKVHKIDQKIEALEKAEQNAAAIAALSDGDSIAYVYGRAANKRVLGGVIRATNTNDKGVRQFKVEYGTGFDAEFHLIDQNALLMSDEEVQAALDEIAAAAEAAASTPEA